MVDDLSKRVAFLLDPSGNDVDRAHMLELVRQENGLEAALIQQLAQDISPYVRGALALAIGHRHSRDSFSYLLKLMQDHDIGVQKNTATALGFLRDSRALFPLVNHFMHAQTQLKLVILQSLDVLRDPRARDFLQIIADYDEDTALEAREIIGNYRPNPSFLYEYAGPEQLFAHAPTKTGQISVFSARNLDENEHVLREAQAGVGHTRPQTYIISKKVKLIIGGILQEHVFVARGDPVLAAGEIVFEKAGGQWCVAEVNNRSNGYYPGKECFSHVKRALDHAGIYFAGSAFSQTFPERGYFTDDFLMHQPLFPK